jgi:hypothetical protein
VYRGSSPSSEEASSQRTHVNLLLYFHPINQEPDMIAMLRGGRYRNARVARPIFDLSATQADQLLAAPHGCARPVREVYT